uniref:Uncharacterized protein n=1 Tax=Chrysemys picta bellii TaxID=8478 RepID=A0A8C3IMJ9_CHRPI
MEAPPPPPVSPWGRGRSRAHSRAPSGCCCRAAGVLPRCRSGVPHCPVNIVGLNGSDTLAVFQGCPGMPGAAGPKGEPGAAGMKGMFPGAT